MQIVSPNEYVSPEENIDASTCLFIEQTWFIKDVKHPFVPDTTDRMTDDLLYYDGRTTIDTFPEYPRFLEYNSKYGYLIADAEQVLKQT